jgi:hypothetical protein
MVNHLASRREPIPQRLRATACGFRKLADETGDPEAHEELLRLAETCLKAADDLERAGQGGVTELPERDSE